MEMKMPNEHSHDNPGKGPPDNVPPVDRGHHHHKPPSAAEDYGKPTKLAY
jgi:hypothetical protein